MQQLATASSAPPGLSIAAGAALNLTDNDLIYDYADASPSANWNGSSYTGVTGRLASTPSSAPWLDRSARRLCLAEASELLNSGRRQTPLCGRTDRRSTTVS
jgi:hypothetical protein